MEESFDIVYMREDVGALYSPEERDEMLHDLVLENFVEVRQEELEHRSGVCSSRVASSNTDNVVGWHGEKGVFIGLDPDTALISTTMETYRSVFEP